MGYSNRVVTIDTIGSGSVEYKEPDISKMNKLDKSVIEMNKLTSNDKKVMEKTLMPIYDGAGWNWNVQLIKGELTPEKNGFGVRYTESNAGALYLITTTGEWIRADFPFPGGASYPGNHLGKEIDKAFFMGGKNLYLVDIPNFVVEK